MPSRNPQDALGIKSEDKGHRILGTSHTEIVHIWNVTLGSGGLMLVVYVGTEKYVPTATPMISSKVINMSCQTLRRIKYSWK